MALFHYFCGWVIFLCMYTSSVHFSRSVVSDSLWPHELQHTRPPCPSPTPGVYSNSCPSSQWCHPAILCRPLLLLPPIPPSIRVFSNESTLHMRWPKYWSFSFSISPSNEHPGLISFRMDIPHLYPFLHRHLGCFHVLAIVNSAVMKIGVHVFFQIMVYSGMPRNEIAWSCDNSIFSWGNSILFSIVAVSIYLFTNSVGGFPFLHTLSSTFFCRFFDDGHSDWCEVMPRCSFNMHFSNS